MKSLFVLLLISSVVAIACKKEGAKNNEAVWIRIENNSASLMTDVKIGDTSYNGLAENAISAYKKIEFPVYAAYCSFKVNGQDVWAGYGICGSPMPPPFEPGFYTFKVRSTTNPNFYSIETVKR